MCDKFHFEIFSYEDEIHSFTVCHGKLGTITVWSESPITKMKHVIVPKWPAINPKENWKEPNGEI